MWHLSALRIFSTIFHNMGKHGAFIKTTAALWAHAKIFLQNTHSSPSAVPTIQSNLRLQPAMPNGCFLVA